MNELLTYLVSHLSFLYDDYGARFVDSQVRGPHAFLVLEADKLQIRLLRDRSQIFVDFKSRANRSEEDWTSYDIIHQFLTGEITDSAVMDNVKVKFIREHFPDIIDAYSDSKRKDTETKLHEYEQARAERLFG